MTRAVREQQQAAYDPPTEQRPAMRPVASSPLRSLAEKIGCDPEWLHAELKQRIKGGRGDTKREATNEELFRFCAVANQYHLNPLTNQIHAFVGKDGRIVPVVGIDGWCAMVNDHPQYAGMPTPPVTVFGDDGKPISCTVTLARKDHDNPTTITEYYAECYRQTEPWNQMPARMLRHKAYMQCARVAFSLGGIYDEDEAEKIIGQIDLEGTERRLREPRRKSEAAVAYQQPPTIETQPESPPTDETQPVETIESSPPPPGEMFSDAEKPSLGGRRGHAK